MNFGDFWREHRQKTGASGASEMQRHFYHWLYLRGTITLAERNNALDNIERG